MAEFGFGKKKKGPSKKWTKKEIDAECLKFDKRREEAEEREGDVEIRDAIFDKALFLKDEAKDYTESEKVFRLAYEKTGGASRKMEILFEILLMNLENYNMEAIKKDVAACKGLIDEGADWDKKNKLKVFEGVYCMLIRDFNRAAELFLSNTATFTCVELMDYKDFVFYTVIMSMVTQDRKTLKKEIIHSPDVLSCIRDIPNLKNFSDSFYNCKYGDFFVSFVDIIDVVSEDKYLRQHVHFFTKQMRLVAYK
jgi:26S proteasome regulatory subunit N7